MLHSTEDILPVDRQELLAKYLSMQVSFPLHDDQGAV